MRKEYDFSKGKKGVVVASRGKTRITIMLDDEVIEHFRGIAEKQGTGYQTMINAVLRSSMQGNGESVSQLTLEDIRAVLREELNSLNVAA